MTSIEGDEIMSSAEPPDDWSHPPSVNSLEPTVIEEQASSSNEKKKSTQTASHIVSAVKFKDKQGSFVNSLKGAASNRRRYPPPRIKEDRKVCVIFHGLSNGEVLAVSKVVSSFVAFSFSFVVAMILSSVISLRTMTKRS